MRDKFSWKSQVSGSGNNQRTHKQSHIQWKFTPTSSKKTVTMQNESENYHWTPKDINANTALLKWKLFDNKHSLNGGMRVEKKSLWRKWSDCDTFEGVVPPITDSSKTTKMKLWAHSMAKFVIQSVPHAFVMDMFFQSTCDFHLLQHLHTQKHWNSSV